MPCGSLLLSIICRFLDYRESIIMQNSVAFMHFHCSVLIVSYLDLNARLPQRLFWYTCMNKPVMLIKGHA